MSCELGARELAGYLLALCACGISWRQRGWCLGEPRASEVSTEHGCLVFTERGARRSGSASTVRRHAAHLRYRHGAACFSLGVCMQSAERLLRARDATGATGLMMEAFEAAVAELAWAVECGEWTPKLAEEAIAYSVRVRLTPSGPYTGTGPELH